MKIEKTVFKSGYWDTSVLVKLYVKELDSVAFEQLASETEKIITSRLAFFELKRALHRKEMEGALIQGASQSCFQQFISDVEDGMIQLNGLGSEIEGFFETVLTHCFSQKPSILIRSADAIHLATALSIQPHVMVCTDIQMRKAANSLGLNLLPSV